MKTERKWCGTAAFTLVEFLILIAIIAILSSMLLPSVGGPQRARVSMCRNNLQHIGVGFEMWLGEHQGRFPWQVSITNGGTLESATAGHAAPSFQTLSNYLASQPSRLICPADKSKRAATNFAALTEQNISYFLNLDAVTNSAVSILSGDRHLQANGQPVKPGLLNVTTTMAVEWTAELHSSGKLIGGNLLFSDGHAQFTRESLQRIVRQQPQATNRLVIP